MDITLIKQRLWTYPNSQYSYMDSVLRCYAKLHYSLTYHYNSDFLIKYMKLCVFAIACAVAPGGQILYHEFAGLQFYQQVPKAYLVRELAGYHSLFIAQLSP